MAEDRLEGLVQVLVIVRPATNVDEQLARQNVEALLPNGLGPAELCLTVAEVGVVEGRVAGLALVFVEVGGEVLRDESVEQHPEYVLLEVPAVDAAPEVVRDSPDRLVQLSALRFLRHSPGSSPAISSS